MAVLSSATNSFSDVCKAMSGDNKYESFLKRKARFLEDNFHTPQSFRLQRYEEITDPTVAVKLFVPFEQLMKKITVFGNMYVSGNRGSGKSTYLASLAFFPRSLHFIHDVKEIFGVYFPCRQREFQPLYARPEWSAKEGKSIVTNILMLKVIRRTLETVSEAVTNKTLSQPLVIEKLRDFVAGFVPAPGVVSVDRDIQSELENLVSTMVRVEMVEIDRIRTSKELFGNERDARCLIEFFGIVRETFGALAATRFHLLFDDAGAPHVPENVQQCLNDLMLASNPMFCVKLSAEKLTFQFVSSDGKALENGQDYVEHDISQILFIGTGTGGLTKSRLEEYFRKIVEKRLEEFSYRSTKILDYIGDQQISLERLLFLLSIGRKDSYYCGWTTVWHVADRTPRNLLELVSEILSVGGIEPTSDPSIVSKRDQDRAIQTISEKRLESLSQISGSIQINGRAVSLGRHLYDTTVTIGSTFRRYLRVEGKNEKQRPRQHLAIERNDLVELSEEADIVLRRLITFGILDASKATFARDDEIKKPYYILNRIFCPTFKIGYHRDEHLRLSRRKLELLLIDPERFMKEGTKRLREMIERPESDLFNYGGE
jgi:hypothetical protein